MNPQIKFVVPQSWTSDEKGKFFEDVVGKLLKKMRFQIEKRVKFTGMEIDVLAKNIDTQQKAFVECKFMTDPLQAGVIHKLMGKALLKKAEFAYLFSTSPPGKEAKGTLIEIEEDSKNNPPSTPRLIFKGPEKLTQMYIDIEGITPISKHISSTNFEKDFGNATILVSPSISFWAVEQIIDGIPKNLLIYSLYQNKKINLDEVKNFIKENPTLWPGLEISLGGKTETPTTSGTEEEKEVITQVPMAEQFDDYRPCRPDDFVGRYEEQKQLWDFLKKLREGKMTTRIISLIGPSGFGKSSMILKLSSRFKNKHFKKKFYLYHVDTRSASSPLFVTEAVRSGFQKAIDEGFIEIPNLNISIESSESILTSKSIQTSLKRLGEEKKVLIIFFDQFEELFTKEELYHTFENFKKVALGVDSIKENLVLGFSWRTGITLMDTNPAYHMWNSLKDLRFEIKLEAFDSSEISHMLKQLEKYINEPLEKQLKVRLKEQCRGYPWLLKKLCIHVYRQMKKGVSQLELITRQLNIETLFKEDTHPLAPKQLKCLKYIAHNSPVEITDVTDKYEQQTVDSLYVEHRLIIRTGHRYAVYWDIFRDYLIDETVPLLPLTYMPLSQLGTILKVINLLNKEGPKSDTEIISYLGCTRGSFQNFIADLFAFIIVKRLDNENFTLVRKLKSSTKIADYLYDQLKQHKVLQDIEKDRSDDIISLDDFREFVSNAYSQVGLKPQSVNVYTNRLLQWFSFSGLAEISEKGIKVSLGGKGKNKGVLKRSPNQRYSQFRKPTFLCSSSPRKAVELVERLIVSGGIEKDEILENKFKNTAYDTNALELSYWEKEKLLPSDELSGFFKDTTPGTDEVKKIVEKKAMESSFLKALIEELEIHRNRYEIGERISQKIGRKWSSSSKVRYLTAGMTWLKYFDLIKVPKKKNVKKESSIQITLDDS